MSSKHWMTIWFEHHKRRTREKWELRNTGIVSSCVYLWEAHRYSVWNWIKLKKKNKESERWEFMARVWTFPCTLTLPHGHFPGKSNLFQCFPTYFHSWHNAGGNEVHTVTHYQSLHYAGVFEACYTQYVQSKSVSLQSTKIRCQINRNVCKSYSMETKRMIMCWRNRTGLRK